MIRKTSRTLVTLVMSVREEQIVSIYRNVYVAMGDYTHPILPELLETPKDNKTTTYCLKWQKRECGESRKNLLYGARLNPKHRMQWAISS